MHRLIHAKPPKPKLAQKAKIVLSGPFNKRSFMNSSPFPPPRSSLSHQIPSILPPRSLGLPNQQIPHLIQLSQHREKAIFASKPQLRRLSLKARSHFSARESKHITTIFPALTSPRAVLKTLLSGKSEKHHFFTNSLLQKGKRSFSTEPPPPKSPKSDSNQKQPDKAPAEVPQDPYDQFVYNNETVILEDVEEDVLKKYLQILQRRKETDKKLSELIQKLPHNQQKVIKRFIQDIKDLIQPTELQELVQLWKKTQPEIVQEEIKKTKAQERRLLVSKLNNRSPVATQKILFRERDFKNWQARGKELDLEVLLGRYEHFIQKFIAEDQASLYGKDAWKKIPDQFLLPIASLLPKTIGDAVRYLRWLAREKPKDRLKEEFETIVRQSLIQQDRDRQNPALAAWPPNSGNYTDNISERADIRSFELSQISGVGQTIPVSPLVDDTEKNWSDEMHNPNAGRDTETDERLHNEVQEMDVGSQDPYVRGEKITHLEEFWQDPRNQRFPSGKWKRLRVKEYFKQLFSYKDENEAAAGETTENLVVEDSPTWVTTPSGLRVDPGNVSFAEALDVCGYSRDPKAYRNTPPDGKEIISKALALHYAVSDQGGENSHESEFLQDIIAQATLRLALAIDSGTWFKELKKLSSSGEEETPKKKEGKKGEKGKEESGKTEGEKGKEESGKTEGEKGKEESGNAEGEKGKEESGKAEPEKGNEDAQPQSDDPKNKHTTQKDEKDKTEKGTAQNGKTGKSPESKAEEEEEEEEDDPEFQNLTEAQFPMWFFGRHEVNPASQNEKPIDEDEPDYPTLLGNFMEIDEPETRFRPDDLERPEGKRSRRRLYRTKKRRRRRRRRRQQPHIMFLSGARLKYKMINDVLDHEMQTYFYEDHEVMEDFYRRRAEELAHRANLADSGPELNEVEERVHNDIQYLEEAITPEKMHTITRFMKKKGLEKKTYQNEEQFQEAADELLKEHEETQEAITSLSRDQILDGALHRDLETFEGFMKRYLPSDIEKQYIEDPEANFAFFLKGPILQFLQEKRRYDTYCQFLEAEIKEKGITDFKPLDVPYDPIDEELTRIFRPAVHDDLFSFSPINNVVPDMGLPPETTLDNFRNTDKLFDVLKHPEKPVLNRVEIIHKIIEDMDDIPISDVHEGIHEALPISMVAESNQNLYTEEEAQSEAMDDFLDPSLNPAIGDTRENEKLFLEFQRKVSQDPTNINVYDDKGRVEGLPVMDIHQFSGGIDDLKRQALKEVTEEYIENMREQYEQEKKRKRGKGKATEGGKRKIRRKARRRN